MKQRCAWAGSDPAYLSYHDKEWGIPEYESRALFEKLLLDGFQAGLSWITILRKREAFREAAKEIQNVFEEGLPALGLTQRQLHAGPVAQTCGGACLGLQIGRLEFAGAACDQLVLGDGAERGGGEGRQRERDRQEPLHGSPRRQGHTAAAADAEALYRQ